MPLKQRQLLLGPMLILDGKTYFIFLNNPVTFYHPFRKKEFGHRCLRAIIKPLRYKLAIENINILSVSPLIN